MGHSRSFCNIGAFGMSASSTVEAAASRKSSQTILGVLARMPLERIAEAIGKDESTACRVRSGEARLTVMELGSLLDAAAQKVVSIEQVCVRRDKLGAMATLLAAAFADEQTTHRLVWEDAA